MRVLYTMASLMDFITCISLTDDIRYISAQTVGDDFDEILYTAADFELDQRHVIKNEKVALDRLRVRQNVFLVLIVFSRLDRSNQRQKCCLWKWGGGQGRSDGEGISVYIPPKSVTVLFTCGTLTHVLKLQ